MTNWYIEGSFLFTWVLQQWLQTLLTRTYTTGTLCNQLEAGEITEDVDTEQLLDPGEEDAADMVNVQPTTIPGRLVKWLSLSFATTRYCSEIAWMKVDSVRSMLLGSQSLRCTMVWSHVKTPCVMPTSSVTQRKHTNKG
ncbi:hypothetical protein BJ508DRAFT_23721 [Ascobolus immersus RN42]|uniref:Uncharacterized protein n=1 Tax=Ascobolus immersus RN42 TaxID=1160509 RepID=A0A3N4HRN3_ASCIM|nr:hypothetical protein BJ508DRAFT_23721 [Ascobolus immersus RN42]